MSGVPAFTAGELDALIAAASVARDVTRVLVAYGPSVEVEQVDADLASGLAKLRAMTGVQSINTTEESNHGAANPV